MSVDPTGAGAGGSTPPPTDPGLAGTTPLSPTPSPQPPTYHGAPQPSTYGVAQPSTYGVAQPQPPSYGTSSPSYPGTPQPLAYAPPASPAPTYPPASAYAGGVPPVSSPPTSDLSVAGGQWQSPGPVVAQIGEIAVTATTVRTPSGDIPLAGSQWHVADSWHAEQKTPTWAIVLAIVGFCVLTVLSLLFLLAKETVYRGVVQVTVTNGPRQYVARIPVTTQQQVQYIYQQVNYVRSLAAV